MTSLLTCSKKPIYGFNSPSSLKRGFAGDDRPLDVAKAPLLCLYGLGTNTGLKRGFVLELRDYTDLVRQKRFIHKEHLRNAITPA